MRRSGVLCAGTIVVDVAKVIDAYPPLDHLATISEISVSPGGPGLNLAIDLRLLGAGFPIAVLGALGEDEHGALVLAECERLGIDTSGVRRTPGATTSFTDVMVEREGGRRTFFHHPGASDELELAATDLERSGARIFHAGSPGLHARMDAGGRWAELLERARAAGMHTNLELVDIGAERLEAFALPCLPHLDSVVINELEAGALTGLDAEVPSADAPVDWDALEEMARRLVARGVAALAVVHFPAGCVAAAPGGRTWRQGSVRLPREEVRSTTGAGDAFAAGAMLGVHEGFGVERCLRLGVASAAACIRGPGTSGALRAAEACLADADRAGFRPTGAATPPP
jgi:sugar/nucleoside kinase (ribokinase family)